MTKCKNCGNEIRAKNYPTDLTWVHRQTVGEVCDNPEPVGVL